MRLTYVIDSLSAAGGAERSLAELAPRWVAAGDECEVVTLKPVPGLQDVLRSGGVPVTSLDGSRPRLLAALRDHLRRRRPDLVHTTLYEADVLGRVAARAAGVPVVSSLVSTSYGAEQYQGSAAYRARLLAAQGADAATARLAVRMHAVSEHVREVTARRLRYPLERVDVVPRGRDPQGLGTRTPERRAAVRTRLGVPDDALLLLSVARHEHAKGLDRVVAALPELAQALPGLRLLVAGQPGRETPRLHALVHQHGVADRVTWLGQRDDVPDLMVAADVLLNLSRREGSPGAVIEAMALGLPVVTSDLGPTREVLDGPRCGWLVPPDRPDRVRAAVLEALAGGTTRTREAHERFRSAYTLDAVAARMREFQARAVSG